MDNDGLPPPIYLPSTGGYTNSRLSPELVGRTRFPFRRWSIDQDGNMVVRTRTVHRDARARPYEKHPVRFATTPPRRKSVSLDPEPSLPPLFDPGTSAEVLNRLASALQDPETFEASASSIFSAHDIEPSIAAALMRLGRSKQNAGTRSQPVGRAQSLGPPTIQTNSTSSGSSTVVPLVPFKQERPFSSGHRGSTIWYTTVSHNTIPEPPASIEAVGGYLYVHKNLSDATNQVWLFGINAQWAPIPSGTKIAHPLIADRVLSIRADGTPSWVTVVGFASIQNRKDRVRLSEVRQVV